MSDSLLQTFIHYGTNAQRLAFTPSPPASPEQPIYVWYETDSGETWVYDTSWHQITGASIGTVTHTGALTSGVNVVGNGGADITVSSLTANLVASSSGTLAGAVAAANTKLLGSGTSGSGAAYSELTVGSGLSMSGTTLSASSGVATRAITFAIDGDGSALTTGVKADVYVPYAATITSVTMLADQSGSVVVDIWKAAYASYPPTVANTITAAALPTISAATHSQDTTLTGWTTSISAGDTLRFNINSASTITRLNLTLTVTV